MCKDYAEIHYLKLQFSLYFFSQPTMLQWIELLTKQFNNSQAACEVSDLGTQQSTNQLSMYCLTFLEVRIPGIFWTMNCCIWYICALWDEIHPLWLLGNDLTFIYRNLSWDHSPKSFCHWNKREPVSQTLYLIIFMPVSQTFYLINFYVVTCAMKMYLN